MSPPCRRIFTVFCYYAPNGSLLRVSQNGNNRGFPNRIARFQKARASNVLSFRRYASDILFVSLFIRPCDRSHRAVRLDSVFRFRKVRERLRGALISAKYANACSSFVFSPLLRYSGLGIRPEALGYPPSGSVNAAILSPRLLIFSANTRKTPTFKSLGMPDREVLIRDIRKYAR